jgi:lipoprotein NlpI
MRRAWLILVVLSAVSPARAETVEECLRAGQAALQKGKTDEALKLANQALQLDPKSAPAHLLRGTVYDVQRKFDDALANLTRALELDPQLAAAYNRRGSVQFKRGKIPDSIADFDRYLELRPQERPGHWMRGISLYYAGRFDEGRKQFAAYEAVDTNDVENSVWHFLCNARLVGVEAARAGLLKIGKDQRVPMMEVFALFAGKSKPEDVLQAAQAGSPAAPELKSRLFFAHLYLGLYHEAMGDARRAREHLTKAAEDYPMGHYMWEVARVHVELLRKRES